MIRLERITLREIHLPLVEPFRTAHGEVRVRRILLLELVDATGARMWSECVAQADPGYSKETVDSCWAMIHGSLAEHVVGKEFSSPGEAAAILRAASDSDRMASAAVEMGIWGLQAFVDGQPLARFLAAASRENRALRRHVETGIALGMQSSEAGLLDQVRSAVADGYRRIKLKVGPQDALAKIGAIRSALGRDVVLSADANGSFRLDNPAHVTALEGLDDFGLVMIEQPLAPEDLRAHARLRRMIRTPICLDESIWCLNQAHSMWNMQAGQVINLKPGRVGGFSESIAIHDFAVLVGCSLWCGGMLESGIGRAYNVALASLPGFSDPGDLSPSARYWTRDVVTPAWTMDAEGRVKVPLDEAGLGVAVDVDFIDDCTVRTAVVSAR